MPIRAKFDVGQRFGRLTIQEEGLKLRNPDGSTYRNWVCICDCGNKTIVRTQGLTKGKTQSCGCLQKERASQAKKSHGAAGTILYTRWRTMISRCTNPKQKAYTTYGAAGISVCPRWKKFENFLEDMGLPEPGMTLDRIDNSKGYYKENCRWTTKIAQARNRTDNRFVSLKGKTLILVDAAAQLKLTAGAIYQRMKRHNVTAQQAVDYFVTRAQDTLTLQMKES